MNKWLKLNEQLILFGPGGCIRMKSLGKYDEARKAGLNTELFDNKKSLCYVKETLEQLEVLLFDNTKS